MATGCEGHLFSARMPFSWILIRLINETLSLPHPAVELQEQEGILSFELNMPCARRSLNIFSSEKFVFLHVTKLSSLGA